MHAYDEDRRNQNQENGRPRILPYPHVAADVSTKSANAISLMNLQRTARNAAVVSMMAGGVRPLLQVSRQPEDGEEPEYPPDWQHGAPTKPVAPDPHVSGPEPAPEQGPYRKPAERDDYPPDSPQPEQTTRERIAGALKKAGVPAWAVAGVITLVIAAIADPEPFSKIALIIGSAAAIAFLIIIGMKGAVPSGAAAANDGPTADDGEAAA